MTGKVTRKREPDSKRTICLVKPADGDVERELARVSVRPSVQAATTIQQWSPVADLDINHLIAELQDQSNLASSGSLARAEAMLIDQAHTLDAIFNNLARRAHGAEPLPQFETFLRLGLKAQSQCRATLETLARMKNPPPVAFVQQANIAHGPQQVNNARQPSADTASRARESEYQPNKLLEQQPNDCLDTRAPQATVGADSALEPVGAIHGPGNARGQG